MSDISVSNIFIEVFGAIMSLILIICLHLDENKDSKLNRIFFQMLAWNIVLMICDAISYAVIGNTTIYGFYLIRITNFLVYCISFVLLALYTNYVVTYINAKNRIPKIAVYINRVICAVAILLTIISQFYNLFYYFDEYNVFHRQASWIPQALAISCFFVMAFVIIRNKKHLNKREFFFLISYILLPIVAVAIQFFIYDPVLMFMATTLSLFSVYTGIQADQSRLIKQQELELTQSRISIMLSQIHPHFLYNSLTAIGEVCDIDPRRAKAAVTDFAHYLRGNLESLTNRQMINFEDELDHVETYLAMECLRFGDRLQVRYEILTEDFKVPPLTVQPIVENAVQHGLFEKDEGGTVCIRTEAVDNTIRITVTDDGIGFDPPAQIDDSRIHIGIENVRGRLHAMCGGSLEIESVIGTGTTAVITIPQCTDKEGQS